MWRPGFDPWVVKIPWRSKRLPTPVFWHGGFHGLYSPWGCRESDVTERLNWTEPFPSTGDLPNPGIKLRSFTLQADFLPAEPQGKPENTGVGSLSLLQLIFPTQELNWGLLHCRWILYQLSYQGTPSKGPTTSWQIYEETMETVTDFITGFWLNNFIS